MENTKQKVEGLKPVPKPQIPNADIDFAAVVHFVSKKWRDNEWLVLKWLTVATFETEANTFNAILDARMQSGGSRPQIAHSLRVLDKKMNAALSYVKGYIMEKHKKESGKSYYASFGLEKKGYRNSFPHDRNKRLVSLELMIEALQTNGFADKEYGTAFWLPIKEQYELLLQQQTAVDGQISVKVGDKNILKKKLKKGLNAIIHNIKSNYPDTYKQELRNWGFQKERY